MELSSAISLFPEVIRNFSPVFTFSGLIPFASTPFAKPSRLIIDWLLICGITAFTPFISLILSTV